MSEYRPAEGNSPNGAFTGLTDDKRRASIDSDKE